MTCEIMKKVIKEELPHLKYIVECLSRDGLTPGPLPEIIIRLEALINEKV